MADDVTMRYRLVGEDVSASKALDGVADSVEQVEKKFAGLKKGAGAAALAAGAAAGGLLAKGLADNLNIEVANDRLAGHLGLTTAEAQRAGDIAGAVYANNFGTSIDDVNTAIQAVGTNLADVGAASQAEIQGMTEAALALASTFDVDVQRSTGAAAALIKNGLAKDSTEAFDILTAGFQAGADKAGDFTETLTEYSPQFAKLGIDGASAITLLRQGLQAGARDTDVIADAFKEFSLRAIDGSKLTSEGYKALGLDARETAAAIAAGGDGAEEATFNVLQSLALMKDPIAQNAAGVALFGTQWEDTLRQILPALTANVNETTKVTGATQAMIATVGDNAAGRIDTAKRSFEQWTQSMASSDSALGTVVTGLATFGGGALAAGGQVGSLVAGLGAMNVAQNAGRVATALSTGAQWLWNAALAANPIGLVIIAIAALVAGLVWFFTKTETGRRIWAAAMAGMQTAFTAFLGTARSVLAWVSTNWDRVINTFRAAPSRVSGAFSSMFNGLRNGFRAAINFIIRGWNRLRFTIPSVSFMGVSSPSYSIGVPAIPLLAQGGIVTSPTLAVVGEAGPEAVVPLSQAGAYGLGPGGGDLHVHVQAGAVGSEDYLARTIRDVLTRTEARGYGY